MDQQRSPRTVLPAALGLVSRALRRRARAAGPERAAVVVPDVVAQACAALLEAKERGASLDELLTLAHGLHEAELAHARRTAAAGGEVPQALRDELLLRDRPTWVQSSD